MRLLARSRKMATAASLTDARARCYLRRRLRSVMKPAHLILRARSPVSPGLMASTLSVKRGPSVLQPYRDLAKLLRKASATSEHASWVFHSAPVVAFACYLTVSAIVPIITSEPLPLAFLADLIGGAFVLALAGFMVSLAALDTVSPMGGLGSSRTTWVGSLAGPALILVFFTVGVLSASDN